METRQTNSPAPTKISFPVSQVAEVVVVQSVGEQRRKIVYNRSRCAMILILYPLMLNGKLESHHSKNIDIGDSKLVSIVINSSVEELGCPPVYYFVFSWYTKLV